VWWVPDESGGLRVAERVAREGVVVARHWVECAGPGFVLRRCPCWSLGWRRRGERVHGP
jgi:hypothetical protein